MFVLVSEGDQMPVGVGACNELDTETPNGRYTLFGGYVTTCNKCMP